MPVIFITDALIFLLVFVIAMFAWFSSRYEHLCEPWKQVRKSKLAMISAVFLAFYVVTGLLDSMHFHPALSADKEGKVIYSSEIESVLDIITDGIRSRTETTYSAPFAAYGYSREFLTGKDGKIYRGYPRLTYGGAHLTDPDNQRYRDILVKTVTGFCYGTLAWLIFSVLCIYCVARANKIFFRESANRILHGQLPTPWKSVIVTAGILILMISTIAYLSGFYHVFGTDKVGQDVLYQALKSVRTGLLIGTLTTLVMLPFALVLGIMAGYFRGWVDDVIQYLYTTLNSIPGVLLIAASILILEVYMNKHAAYFTSVEQRADMRLLFLCMILGITNWTGLCRLLRGEALKLREVDYVQAAQAFGVSNRVILVRHLLPNVMHIVMISIVIDFSGLVLAEAVLAYINIGVDPTMSSWGNMINSARLELAREPVVWWSLSAAFVFMLGLVLPANLFADAVRDAFDPRMRQVPE